MFVTETWRQKVIDHQPYFRTCAATHRVVEKKPNIKSTGNSL